MENGKLFIGGNPDERDSLKGGDDLSRNRDRTIIPRFFIGVHRKPDGSGFLEKEYLELLIPGDPKSAPVHLVTDYERNLYSKHYKAFIENREMPTDGTPIEHWLGAGDPRVLALKSMHLTTVERVAAMSDVVAKDTGLGGLDLRTRAKKFLEVQKDTTAAEQITARDDTIKELMERIAKLEAGGSKSDVKSEGKWPSEDKIEGLKAADLRDLLTTHGVGHKEAKSRDELINLALEARNS